MKAFIFTLLISFPLLVSGQNRSVRGNGHIISKQKILPAFDALYIDMFCDVYVTVGSMPQVDISGDKNTINKISLEVNDKELRIVVKEGFWLRNTRPQIYLQTPYLTKITTKGHQTNIGNIRVEGIEVDQFELDLLYGNIELLGKTNNLVLRSSNRSYYDNRSILDASSLIAGEVYAKIQGSNSALVQATEELMVSLQHDAVLEYVNEPERILLRGSAILTDQGIVKVKGGENAMDQSDKKETERITLKYVKLKIKNNTLGRKHFVIEGPNESGRNFSYGFPMLPFATREKKVPIGTKIFLQKSGIAQKNLITIKAADNGKVINLFSK